MRNWFRDHRLFTMYRFLLSPLHMFRQSIRVTIRRYYEDPNFLRTYGPIAVLVPFVCAFLFAWIFPFPTTALISIILVAPYVHAVGVAIVCKQLKELDNRFGGCSDRLEAWAKQKDTK